MKYYIYAMITTAIGVAFPYVTVIAMWWLEQNLKGIDTKGIGVGAFFFGTGYLFLIIIMWVKAFNNGKLPGI